MKIPVLERNEKLGLDNTQWTWEEIQEKLSEEYIELQNAIVHLRKSYGTIDHIAEETFDVIQICIGILDKVESIYPGMTRKMAKRHLNKLIERGWDMKDILQVVKSK